MSFGTEEKGLPYTLPPINRRQFLAGSIAVGLGAVATKLASPAAAAAALAGPQRIVLLSDTHISANPFAAMLGLSNVTNLTRIVEGILELPRQPACVIVNGDCSLSNGRRHDYSKFFDLLAPLRQAQIPIHLALGNHDHRHNFWHALPANTRPAKPVVDERQISVIANPLADLYLLDSLDVTNDAPGRLGEAQLQWLAERLDANPSRPALMFAHHNPGEMIDTRALLQILSPRRQVKAFFFGHTHTWSVDNRRADGLHLINLPPTSYVFEKNCPIGWVDLSLTARGGTLRLISLDPTHPQHGQNIEIPWRV